MTDNKVWIPGVGWFDAGATAAEIALDVARNIANKRAAWAEERRRESICLVCGLDDGDSYTLHDGADDLRFCSLECLRRYLRDES